MSPFKRFRWFLLILFVLGAIAQSPSPLPFFRVGLGEPSIWSMEQAHYLLSRMGARSQGLLATLPKDTDLDVTAANGLRYNALRTLLGISAGYDANLALPNQIAAQRLTADNQRYADLQTELTKLNKDQIATIQQIATLNVQKAQVPAGSDGDALRTQLQSQIDPLTVQQTAQQARIDQITKDLTTLSSASTTLSLPQNPSPSPNGNFTLSDPAVKILKDNGISLDGGKLNTSAVIDAFVQLDQELIMKQVTMLRDEAGSGRRIVFLELPASFYPVSAQANDYIAQVQWRVAGFTESTQQAGPQRREDILNNARRAMTANPLPPNMPQPPAPPASNVGSRSGRGQDTQQATTTPDPLGLRYKAVRPSLKEAVGEGEPGPPEIRTVELVPQVSALNVSDRHDISHGFNLSGVFRFLTGIGVQVSYQRQRQLYESFLQQETFASAYGKGEPEFGWTFGPKPGTTSVSPGIRTAYAILSIPAKTETLTVEGRGCAFRRDDNPPPGMNQQDQKCGPIQRMILVVPQSRDNGFNVNHSVEYVPVFAGQRVTLKIGGEYDYFSRLTGVLVNGVPLKRDISIADPLMTPPAPPPPAGTQNPAPPPSYGEFEVLNPNSLVIAFAMPSDYTGTPDITLVAPAAVQRLDLQPAAHTNGPMFRAVPAVDAAKFYAGPDEFDIEVTGKGFSDDTHLRINGVDVPSVPLSSEVMSAAIAKPDKSAEPQLRGEFGATMLDIRVISAGVPQTDRQAGLSVPNPLLPALSGCELQAAVEHARQRVVKLTGSNFTSAIVTKGFRRLSSTDGLLVYDASDPDPVVITLTEGFLGLETSCLVTKFAPPPTRPTQDEKGGGSRKPIQVPNK
jgi:hypothetical protein